MVDAIVSYAVQRLSDFLIQEADFLLGVKDDVVWLRNEFIWMQSFLDDAEQKQDSDHMIHLWISEIRSIAYKAEDIIDTFQGQVKGTEPSKRKLLTSTLQKCFCVSGETNVYDIGKEIKQLKEILEDVSHKRQVYGIRKLGNAEESASSTALSTRLRDLRRTTSHADEEHFVGFDDELLSSESRRSVVSILGMDGLGKTALARRLYENTNSNETNVHNIRKKIKQLKEKLEVSRERQVYGIRKLGNAEESASSAALSTRLRDLRRTTSHADEEHFVGFDELFSSESRRSVVSIWVILIICWLILILLLIVSMHR